MFRWIASVCLFGLVSLAVACTPPIDNKPLPTAPEVDRKQMVNDNTSFALKMYEQLRADDGNVFFSPYSISSALSMTYAGAKGDTAAEMKQALQFTLSDDKLHPASGWLMIDMNNRGQQGNFILRVANRLWGQSDYQFLKPFLDVTAANYLAGFEPVDFKSTPEEARLDINKWVEDKTEEKIKDLLPPGSVNGQTRLVLTNAIYFKADWKTQFKPENTQKMPFHLNADKQVQVDMMAADKVEGTHGDFDKHVMASLPYKGKELSMYILVPKAKDGISALEASLTPEKLNGWMGKMESVKEMSVKLPKFEFKYKKSLGSALDKLGMKKAFQPGIADFSGISTEEPLHISAVLHQAYIKVNEEGSEAAAATGVVVGTTSVPVRKEITADRPFLFLIRDNTTGSILFLGRVSNPNK